MTRLRATAALVVVTLGIPLGALSASARPHGGVTVTVTMKEFRFALSKQSVPRGTVVFQLVNRGKLAHDFKIAGKKSALIKAGKKGRLVVSFGKKGRYPYICTVAGHAKLGMKGVLKVT